MKTLVMEKGWGRFRAGQKVGVFEPGDELGPSVVDPVRADQLVKDGFASWPAEKAEEAPEGGEDENAAESGVATPESGSQKPRRPHRPVKAKAGRS